MKKTLVITLIITLTTSIMGMSRPVLAEAGDIIVRLRGIGIFPTEESGGISPDLLTSRLEAQAAYVPEIDITYMFTNNIGVELIAATASHDIDAKGAISGLGEVAEARLLPPTLTLQYHFTSFGTFKPYIGAGINVTFIFNEDSTSTLDDALGATKVSADNSVGYALQAGVDIPIGERTHFNIDIKYIDLDSDVTLTSGGITRTTRLEINPVIVGVGIGYRF